MNPTNSQIKDYWDLKAEQLETDPRATMKDGILRSLEIEAINSRLRPEDTLLDVGCGNGFGTLKFAEHCKSALGIDYSEKMIAMARRAIEASGLKNVRAEQGNVLEIGNYYAQSFTAVTCVRCLINLPEEEHQYQAVHQLAQVLVPRGRLLLIEGVDEHLAALNEMRGRMGLKIMPLDWHNRVFKKAALERALRDVFTIEETIDFGEYYFLSRIVHPLLVAPAEPTFEARINQIARTIWHARVAEGKFRDISTLMLYVCHKA